MYLFPCVNDYLIKKYKEIIEKENKEKEKQSKKKEEKNEEKKEEIKFLKLMLMEIILNKDMLKVKKKKRFYIIKKKLTKHNVKLKVIHSMIIILALMIKYSAVISFLNY